ncbi:MAG: ABC transporter ATP-binding protein [Chloroflexi bacterium]|nr:ABC transporter ATP-binding protein [Chloroflexota bacterium]
MIEVRSLSKAFQVDRGEVRALRDVSFEVEDGEFFTLVGPSGSGKSTAIRCVAGLEVPDSGEISIASQVVYSSERGVDVPTERRSIGMVFQSYAIWPHLNVFDNVAFPLRQTRPRPDRAEIERRVKQALGVVRLGGFEQRPAPQLSGGQQQRVALARALVREPRVLLLDEPLSNLDAKLREQMRWEVRELTRHFGITTLYVTHDQVEALSMSDRLGVIVDGALVEVGSPLQLYTRPQSLIVAQFLGGANLLAGTVVESGLTPLVRTELGLVRATADGSFASGAAVHLLIRPENVIPLKETEVQTSGENVFPAALKRSLFVGSFLDGEVAVGPCELRMWTPLRNGIGPGERVSVELPVDQCWLLSAEERPAAVESSPVSAVGA